ncbi:hypothetical protein ACFE04_022650 [Oxalis oulophora]
MALFVKGYLVHRIPPFVSLSRSFLSPSRTPVQSPSHITPLFCHSAQLSSSSSTAGMSPPTTENNAAKTSNVISRWKPMCLYFTQGKCTMMDEPLHLDKFNHDISRDLQVNAAALEKTRSQDFDFFLVLDLEGKVEILEFPVLIVDAKTLNVVDFFHRFVRPCKMSSQRIDEYIEGKYGSFGVDRVWHDTALPFTEVLQQFETWLTEHQLWTKELGGRLNRAAFVTCGDWDIKTKIPQQCNDSKIKLPPYFMEWINLKDVYSVFHGMEVRGMRSMLNHSRIQLLGSHHLGMDDTKNIARVLQRMLSDGAHIQLTARRNPNSQAVKFVFKNRSGGSVGSKTTVHVLTIFNNVNGLIYRVWFCGFFGSDPTQLMPGESLTGVNRFNVACNWHRDIFAFVVIVMRRSSNSPNKAETNGSGLRIRKKHKKLDAICENEYNLHHAEKDEWNGRAETRDADNELRRSTRSRRAPVVFEVSSPPAKKRPKLDNSKRVSSNAEKKDMTETLAGKENGSEGLSSYVWKTRLRSKTRNVGFDEVERKGSEWIGKRRLFGEQSGEMNEKKRDSSPKKLIVYTKRVGKVKSLNNVGKERREEIPSSGGNFQPTVVQMEEENVNDDNLKKSDEESKSSGRVEESKSSGRVEESGSSEHVEASESDEHVEASESDEHVEASESDEQVEVSESGEQVEAPESDKILEESENSEQMEGSENSEQVEELDGEDEVEKHQEIEKINENVTNDVPHTEHDDENGNSKTKSDEDEVEKQQEIEKINENGMNDVPHEEHDDEKGTSKMESDERPKESKNPIKLTDLNPTSNSILRKARIKQGRRCGLCGGGIDGKPPKPSLQDTGESENELYSASSASEEPTYDIWDGFGDEAGWLGRLLGPINDRYGIAGIWVHQQCAVWSPEVYFAGLGHLKNIRTALCRGRALKCTRCGRPGATIGCRVDRCPKTYHLPCARANGCIFDHRKFLIACTDHRHLFQPHGRHYIARMKKLKARKMKLEIRKLADEASRKDFEAEDKWLENCGEDEEFLKRESKRLHRDLLRVAPVYIGGPNSEENRNIFEDWESVAGLQDVIRSMKEVVILPLLYPEFFDNLGLTPPRGILLHGYPGTGKTLVVRALIGSCARGDKRIAYFARKGADCLGKYVGDAERQLRLLFQVAERSQPSIIFFDEIDGLAPCRTRRQDQTHNSVVSTLNFPLQEMLSAAEKKLSGGNRVPLPSFSVEERDWLEALSSSPPPCSRREAGIAANDLATSPLPTHLIPCMLFPLSTLLVSLYLDECVWFPPSLSKAAKIVKNLIVSNLEKKKLPTDRWWTHLNDFLHEADILKELEAKLSYAGIVTGEDNISDPDDFTDVDCDSSKPQSLIAHKGGIQSSLLQHMSTGSRKLGFRILIDGNAKSGQRHLASCILHCFLGNIEVQKIDLATVSQEGHGDVVQGMTQLLTRCASVGSSMVFMPRIDLWAVEPFTQVIENELSDIVEPQGPSKCCSHAWSLFIEQMESMCASSSLMILATSEIPFEALPHKIKQFFQSVSSSESSPMEHKGLRFHIEVGGNFNRDVVITHSSATLSRNLIQSFVQLIHQRSHVNTVPRTLHKACDFPEDIRDTEHQIEEHNGRVEHPADNKTSKMKSSLQLSISTFGYQILQYPHFAELCWVSSKLKEGPYVEINRDSKGWPFHTCIIHSRNSLEKIAIAFRNRNIKIKEKFGVIRGLVAVGLSAYRGVYGSLREVSFEVHKVLELLVGQINAKIQAGKDRYQYTRILSQVAHLEDVVSSWAYGLQSLEVDAHLKATDPKPTVETNLDESKREQEVSRNNHCESEHQKEIPTEDGPSGCHDIDEGPTEEGLSENITFSAVIDQQDVEISKEGLVLDKDPIKGSASEAIQLEDKYTDGQKTANNGSRESDIVEPNNSPYFNEDSKKMEHSNVLAIPAEGGLSNLVKLDDGINISSSATASDKVDDMSVINNGTASIECEPSSHHAESEALCVYRICSECLKKLHNVMQNILTDRREINNGKWTVDDVHDVVSSLSVDFLAGIKKLFESEKLFVPVECGCHVSSKCEMESGVGREFVFSDGVLVPSDSKKDVPFHCKFKTLCLCSLLESIVMKKKPF